MSPQSFKETKGLRFIGWNIQSLYSKLDAVKYYIQDLAPDIILFGETWLSEAINDCIIHIPNYNIVCQDRGIGRGGGLLFYISDKYTTGQFDEHMNINVVSSDIESLVVKISWKEILHIYVVGIYRPPSGKIDSYMSNCTSIFENIQSLPKGDKAEIFFLGDFNIDLNTKNGKGKMPSVVNKFVNKFSLRQLINAPTRISTISTISDHVYTNSCNILFCEPLIINVSNHLPIALVRKKQRFVSKNIEFSARSYLRYFLDNLRTMLNDYRWNDFYSLNDVNALWKNCLVPLSHMYR